MLKNKIIVSSSWKASLFKSDNPMTPAFTLTSANTLTNEGRDKALNVLFGSHSRISSWYIALIESNTTVLETCTYAVPIYTESTAYSQATRGGYYPAAASSGLITNEAWPAEFTFTTSKNIYGASLVGGGSSPSTKGDKVGGGTLHCGVKFPDYFEVETSDRLEIVVEIRLYGG